MSKIFKIIIIALVVGVMTGILSAIFLLSLGWITTTREEHSWLIWGLSIFGYILGLIIRKIPHNISQGVPYILNNTDKDSSKVSKAMTPFVFLASLGTHLFGGSAGREGVGLIMGASISQILPQLNASFKQMNDFLIYAGVAAGFSAIFGTPIAAIILIFELQSFKNIKKIDLAICTILSSFIAVIIPHYLGVAHPVFNIRFILNSEIVIYVLVVGLISGLGGQLYYWGLHGYTKMISKFILKVETKLFIGGLCISIFVYLTNSYDYIGIGTDMIAASFISPMSINDFLMKCLLTIMTLGVGFKGGEVTPLFFMGATLSNSVLGLLNFNNFGLSSSLGLVTLFGAVSKVPLASALMGAELFGWKVGCLCIFTCFIARKLMGNKSVYKL